MVATNTRAKCRDRELGAFVRQRRGRVQPEDVGLPAGPRRRTPGLRREEVAQLAGVGVTWYTWLEQGRAANVSDQVLEAVARVLGLDAVERQHMLALAGRGAAAPEGPPLALRPEQVLLLERMLPYPAAIQTDAFDLVASNRTYRHLFSDLDAFPAEERNCAWLMFTDETWRDVLVDRDDVLREVAARLRRRDPQHRGDQRWKRLLDRLREVSPDFVRLWEEHEVAGDGPQTRRYESPRAGRLHIDFQSLWLDARRGDRMIVMTPADARTARRLERLDALVGDAPAWTSREDLPEAAAPRRA